MQLEIKASVEAFVARYNELFGEGKGEAICALEEQQMTTQQEAEILLVMIGHDTELLIKDGIVSLSNEVQLELNLIEE